MSYAVLYFLFFFFIFNQIFAQKDEVMGNPFSFLIFLKIVALKTEIEAMSWNEKLSDMQMNDLLELKSPGFDGGLWIKNVGDLGGVAPVLLECRRTYLPQNDMSIPGTGASKRSLFSMSWHFEELQFIS